MTKAIATEIITRQQEEERYLLGLKRIYKRTKNHLMIQYVEARLITTRDMLTAARHYVKDAKGRTVA